VNWVSEKLGRGRISLSKKVKNGVKSAIKFINDFETTASDIAIDNGYAYVVCGHIHQPEIRTINNGRGETQYLNSGDWIENLTALEYNDGAWKLYQFHEDTAIHGDDSEQETEEEKVKNSNELFASLVEEFQLLAS